MIFFKIIFVFVCFVLFCSLTAAPLWCSNNFGPFVLKPKSEVRGLQERAGNNRTDTTQQNWQNDLQFNIILRVLYVFISYFTQLN